MKPSLLLLTASLSLVTSAALAQGDACSKNYGACMDRCSSRPGSMQASCSQTCEGASNECYTGMYGKPPSDNQVTITQPAADAQGSAAPAPAESKGQ